jgi:hypothetical protein
VVLLVLGARDGAFAFFKKLFLIFYNNLSPISAELLTRLIHAQPDEPEEDAGGAGY